MRGLLCGLLVLAGAVFFHGRAAEAADQPPRYIFLFIGDGMGKNHVDLAEGLRRAAGKEGLAMTTFPVKSAIRTAAADGSVTESAEAATAIACGHKTVNRMLGLDAEKRPLRAMTIDFLEKGYAIGLVTTTEINDATPAAFYAQVDSRRKLDEIFGQMKSHPPVLFAAIGIRSESGVPLARREEELAEAGFVLPKDLDALAVVAQDRSVWFGFQETSDLPAVTSSAIHALGKNPAGFFLMVEGGQIDWRSHNNETEGMLSEMDHFDEAIRCAVRFKEVHPEETLIVVVGDHETGGLSFDEAWTAKWSSTGHTGADVPLFAAGVGAERFREEAENTAVHNRIVGLLMGTQEAATKE